VHRPQSRSQALVGEAARQARHRTRIRTATQRLDQQHLQQAFEHQFTPGPRSAGLVAGPRIADPAGQIVGADAVHLGADAVDGTKGPADDEPDEKTDDEAWLLLIQAAEIQAVPVGRLFDWASRLARRTYAYIPTFEPAVRRLSSSMFAPGSVPPDPRPLNGLDEDKR